MNLKQKTIRGVAWNGVGKVSLQLLRVVTIVLMARLLTPEDMGIYGILMVFVGFFTIFSNMGISQAVIWLDKPSHDMLSTIFYLNLAVGLSFYSVLYLLAEPIALFFGNDNLTEYVRLIAVTFVIGALNAVQVALLEKELHFGAVVFNDVIAQLAGSLAGILAALAGWGVTSLIVLTLTNSAIKALIYWARSWWRPGLKFSLENLRVIWSYCINLTGFSLINYFSRNTDDFLIGKYIGTSALGIYMMAYNIMLYPLQNLSHVIVKVLFPALSSMKYDNLRLKRSYIKVIRFIALVSFPLMAGLTATAEPFVTVALGNKWAEVAPLLLILAPVGLIQSIVTTVGSIYMVKGTTALMFRIGAVNAVVTVLGFAVGLPFGIEGVAIAYGIANLIMLYPNLKYAWNQIGLGVLEGLAALRAFFLSALLMAGMVFVAGVGLTRLGWSEVAAFAVQVPLGVAIYCSVVILITRCEVLDMVKEVLPEKATRQPVS